MDPRNGLDIPELLREIFEASGFQSKIETHSERLPNSNEIISETSIFVGGPTHIKFYNKKGKWNEIKSIKQDTLILTFDNHTGKINGIHLGEFKEDSIDAMTMSFTPGKTVIIKHSEEE